MARSEQYGFGDNSTSELKVNEPDPCYCATNGTISANGVADSGSVFVSTTSSIQSSVSMVSIDVQTSIPNADGINQVPTQPQELHRYIEHDIEALLVTRNAHGTTERVKREAASTLIIRSKVLLLGDGLFQPHLCFNSPSACYC